MPIEGQRTLESTNAQNNAEFIAAWHEFMNQAQENIQSQRAEAKGSMITNMGLNEIAKATEESLSYLSQWQKTVNGQEEAISKGQEASGEIPSLLFSDGSHEERWETVMNLFPEQPSRTTEDATAEARRAAEAAHQAAPRGTGR